MELEAIARDHSGDDQVNWVTAIFMGLFHVGAVAASFSSRGKHFSWHVLCGGFRAASASG